MTDFDQEPSDLDRAVTLTEQLTKELHTTIRIRLSGESEATIEMVLERLHEQFRFWRNYNPGSDW